jgi:hypothetical protein
MDMNPHGGNILHWYCNTSSKNNSLYKLIPADKREDTAAMMTSSLLELRDNLIKLPVYAYSG